VTLFDEVRAGRLVIPAPAAPLRILLKARPFDC